MPEALALEFDSPTGDRLTFEWKPEAFAAVDPASPPAEPLWTLGGELDWDDLEAVRVLTARLGDERVLGLVALRPAGARGHGEELVTGAVGDGTSFAQLEDPLLSTEYGPDNRPRRVGLEVYPGDDGLALRIAGEARAVEASESGGVRRVAAALELRGPHGTGAGALDILAPA